MKNFLLWLHRRIEWHRLWRLLQDLTWVSGEGRKSEELCQLTGFKAFEAWVDQASTSYRAGNLTDTQLAVVYAAAAFDRLSRQQQLLASKLAADARSEAYMLHVANLCQ